MLRCCLLTAITLAVFLAGSTGRALGAVVVAANASGGFGEPASGGTDLVLGYTFTAAGQAVFLTGSGTIDISGLIVGPDGANLTRAPILGPFPVAYTPLEEKLVDAGFPVPVSDPLSPILNVGALIAAFVPEALATTPGFAPRDSDLTAVGVSSASLFLVGTGPSLYVAPGPGRLYFGVNEPFVSNNGGQFQVTVTAAPEPSGLLLLVVGLGCSAGGVGLRRRAVRA